MCSVVATPVAAATAGAKGPSFHKGAARAATAKLAPALRLFARHHELVAAPGGGEGQRGKGEDGRGRERSQPPKRRRGDAE
jgi:hypothetical protein